MFQVAATTDDLWSGEMSGVTVGNRRVLLVRIDGEVHAYDDRCVHQAVPLSEGTLQGREIICRAHQWRYDACTGRGINPEGVRLRACAVKVEGDRILVDPDVAVGGGSEGGGQ